MSTKRTYWIALLMLLMLTTAGVNAGVRDGLVAYYSFDEGTGATAADLSGNGHDATLPESGVTWIAEGAVGGAINIDGEKGSDVKLGTWNPAEGTGQMSVAAWVKWAHDGNANQSIISKRDGWSAGAMMFDLRMFKANDNFRIYRAGHGGITSPAGGLTPYIGEWVHLGVTTDGAAASLYINGEAVQSGEFVFGDKTDAVMRLGSYNNNSPTLNGDLDEVAIWNRMVPAADMQAIMPGLAAPTIIWVSQARAVTDANGLPVDANGVQDDQGFIDLLVDAGYAVDVQLDHWKQLEGQDVNDVNDYVGELNAADLVIVSRTSSSGNYDDGNEPMLWNGVTTPLIQMSAYLPRNSRWLWLDTKSVSNQEAPLMVVVDPNHPVLTDVLVDEAGTVIALDPTEGAQTTSFLATADAGNGSVIATTLGGDLWIVEWAEGVEFYEGSGHVAGAPRMIFFAGTQELKEPGSRQGGFNLSESGTQLLLNAVDYLIP